MAAVKSLVQVSRCLTRSAFLHRTFPLAVPRRYLPYCTVDTNLADDSIRHDFLPGFSRLIAETLNKPEKLVSISLRTNARVLRDGMGDACVLAEICSIGVFDEQRNVNYSKVFIEYLSSQLGVPTDRIALILRPLDKHDAAHVIYMERHSS